MNGTRRIRPAILAVSFLAASFFAGCTAADETAEEQPADSMAMAEPAGATQDYSGTWNMRAVPETGDTTPTNFQVQVSGGNWVMMLPGRDPINASVVTDGDSVIVDAGPYESVRRAGMQVTTHSVYRMVGGELVGTTIARYQTAGADTVLTLRTTGTRAH